MTEQAKTKIADFKSISELLAYFTDEKKCLEYLVQSRWATGVKCTRCQGERISHFSDGKRYKCLACQNHFTAKVGTIFQDSKLPLKEWFIAMYLIANNKKGMSSIQLAAQVGCSERTAWFLSHRIREGMNQYLPIIQNVAEADETFVGGKNKNRHLDKKSASPYGRSFEDKTPMMGILDRDENTVRCVVVPDTKLVTLHPVLKANVKEGAILVSDEWKGYKGLTEYYHHEIVDHGSKQYLTDTGATTNGIENFWSHFKRGWGATYCGRITKKHLHRYAHEFTFRYNTRSLTHSERIAELMKNIGRPLKYKKLIAA